MDAEWKRSVGTGGVLFLLLLLMIKVSNTNGQVQDNSTKRYFLKDKACWQDPKLVECFQRCEDPMDIYSLYSTSDPTNISVSISQRKKAGAEDIFGCPIRCMTDPDLENCKLSCKSHSDNLFSKCLGQGSCQSWKTQECIDCYKNLTQKDVTVCSSKYLKQCLTYVDDCVNRGNVTGVELLGACFSTKRMEEGLTSCLSTTMIRCRKPGGLCDESCKHLLPNEHCQDTCITQIVETPFKRCLEHCDNVTHPLCNDSCAGIEQCSESCKKNSSTLSCHSICRSRIEELTEHANHQTYFSKAVEECITDSVGTIKTYISVAQGRPIVFPGSDDQQFEWLFTQLLPGECIEICSAAPDKVQCYNDQYKKSLSDVEKKQFCTSDPLRMKAFVHLAAAGGKSLAYSAFNQTIGTNFNGYVINYADTNTTTKFLDTFIDSSVKTCRKDCNSSEASGSDVFRIQNAQCYYRCYERHSILCDYTPLKTTHLDDFSTCQWIVDLSTGKDPTTLTGSYFNERASFDVKENLEKPNTTQYLDQTADGSGSSGFFAFPFFLIIRADCEGGYYDEAFYRLFMDGGYPAVNLEFFPITARDDYQDSLLGRFASVLVSLKFDFNDIMVPVNPLERLAGSVAGCHWKICYPGFALPLMLYRIPVFDVNVEAQSVFNSLTTTLYVSIYNKRGERGSGELKMTNPKSIAVPSMFFPKNRVTEEEDTDMASLKSCLDIYKGYCPEIEHQTDLHWLEYNDDNPSPHGPLDAEDIFAPQFTFRNAPAVAIAGFYHPNLVIIADPDFDKIHLVDWDFQDDNNTIFDDDYQCLRSGSIKAGGYPKPMFSQMDRNDPTYPLKHYRVRYDPRDYSQLEGNPNGIFEIISLEDRLLITTSSGLVVFYGNTNDTVRTRSSFQARDSEKLKKCFKFIRVGKRAQMENDLIIGVTYTYSVGLTSGEKIEVNQEIWVGKLHKAGEPIEWHQIIKKGGAPDDTVDYFFPNEPDAGEVVTLDPGKQVGIPIKIRSDNAKSEIEALCYSVYKSRMASSNEIQLKERQGWCQAIDVSPVMTKADSIQILIRMTVYYIGKVTPDASTVGSFDRNVVLYILATHVLRQSDEQTVTWQIDSIVPRIPCSDEHRESVRNVLLFDLSYFTREGPNSKGETVRGCQNINADLIHDHLYFDGLTYTRILANHVFMFGTRLLQSADGGQTFVSLKSFPHPSELNAKEYSRSHNRHRIKVMAFSDNGHYAFLTNKRELWLGSTGDLKQIRIRPSLGYSMNQMVVSKIKGLQEGVAFTVLYDRKDNLFEVVAVVGNNGEVEKILKRPVKFGTIFRNQKFNEELLKKGKELKESAATAKAGELFTYDTVKWSLFCPFSSPKYSENYSSLYSRRQVFLFSPPRQHPSMGRDFQISSLMAFQVSTFSLLWRSFFNAQYSTYSRFESEPFQRYVDEKQGISTIGLLKFLRGVPEDDGVLVIPDKNKRVIAQSGGRVYRFYYLDYNLILRLELTFSIKDDSSWTNTDYFTEMISQIQLNVDNANGSLIQIDTEKVQLASEASVQFFIHVSVIKSAGLQQNLPGQHLIPVPIVFHLIGGFGNCNGKTAFAEGDTLSTLVYVGCQSAIDILFNWNDTLRSIKFRDKDAHYGRLDESGISECYNGEFVCFFARQPLVLHFDIFDKPHQRYIPFTGNYIMRVIGGGYTRKLLRNSTYTEDEQEAFNIPGVSDVSLIWNEWDIKKSQKIDRKPGFDQKDTGKVTKDVVLQAGKSAIQWACHTLSPCARITPNLYMQTVYYFRISISNRDVDNSTLCLFEKTFDIMLYGFPPSPETQLVTTIVFCLCMLGLLYMLFFCCRGHKRVWRATKVKLYGWYQIVKDTFPKPLKKHESEVADEIQTQQQKDNIILSVQGHLQIPNLVSRDSYTGQAQGINEREDSLTSIASSTLSIRSGFSNMSTQQLLNPVSTRNAATTWTDLVYEQIISKRLTAIVEKNRKMRENILRKANPQVSSDIEQERRYEIEHKRTISDESLSAQHKDDE